MNARQRILGLAVVALGSWITVAGAAGTAQVQGQAPKPSGGQCTYTCEKCLTANACDKCTFRAECSDSYLKGDNAATAATCQEGCGSPGWHLHTVLPVR